MAGTCIAPSLITLLTLPVDFLIMTFFMASFHLCAWVTTSHFWVFRNVNILLIPSLYFVCSSYLVDLCYLLDWMTENLPFSFFTFKSKDYNAYFTESFWGVNELKFKCLGDVWHIVSVPQISAIFIIMISVLLNSLNLCILIFLNLHLLDRAYLFLIKISHWLKCWYWTHLKTLNECFSNDLKILYIRA